MSKSTFNLGRSTLAKWTGKICLVIFVSMLTPQAFTWGQAKLRFNRDVRPILSDKCFACHGPDAETVEGGLRLDLPESARGESNAIIPGDPEASEAIRRIFSNDADELMPPSRSHKPLTREEKEVLRKWVGEGAEYEKHWAYVLPNPDVFLANENESENWIDRLVDRQLKASNAVAVEQADKITLIRRLSFDLTGMPPTPSEVDAFLTDQRDDAYARLVDRLLASPRFGERMAIYWLDLVRYADTVGYHGDQNVSQSPYRDYVIDAFNRNMPYDQFIREQLAGDLLKNPTLEQKVASGYNRLNQTTEEGGSQAKEYLAIYFADRVRNVSQVFMGATVGCAQCHDHKYDPYTAKDFYSLGAFFADIEERGVYGARKRDPMIPVPTAEQQNQLTSLDREIQSLNAATEELAKSLLKDNPDYIAQVKKSIEEHQDEVRVWIDDQQNTGGQSDGVWEFVTDESGPVKSGVHSRRQQGSGIVQHFFLGAKQKVKVTAETRFFTWVYLDPANPPKSIMLQFNDGSWEHRAVWGGDQISFGRQKKSHPGYRRMGKLPATGTWTRLEVSAHDVGLKENSDVVGMAFTQFDGLAFWDQAGWVDSAGPPADVVDALKQVGDRSASQVNQIADYFVSTREAMIAHRAKIEQRNSQRSLLESQITQTVVTQAVKPRTIRILHRGNWMDDSGEVVEPAIPAFLGQLDLQDRRANRLDLANWFVDPTNPLTSRTMANRIWSLMFGRGICKSVDDLGGQGTYPSNPDLLDALAIEFQNSQWDIKHMFRVIANSETYRRSSRPTQTLLDIDPDNDLFARQGRYRVDAEMVRDTALAISGLLVEKLGGPSAHPYQPEKYYAELNFPRRKYEPDHNANQYRRGVYTHWQRTFLHPMLKAFDAPSREECTAARARSNTPLQALTLLNDPTFVEAARVLGARIMREGGKTEGERIEWVYQLAISQKPSEEITSEIQSIYQKHFQHYQSNPEAARQLVSEGYAPTESELPADELAAWTSVARVILNLHETMTRY